MISYFDHHDPLQSYVEISLNEMNDIRQALNAAPDGLNEHATKVLQTIKQELSTLTFAEEKQCAVGHIDRCMPNFIKKLLYIANPDKAVKDHWALRGNNPYAQTVTKDVRVWNSLFTGLTAPDRKRVTHEIIDSGIDNVRRLLDSANIECSILNIHANPKDAAAQLINGVEHWELIRFYESEVKTA